MMKNIVRRTALWGGLLGLVAAGGCYHQAKAPTLSANQTLTLEDALASARMGQGLPSNRVGPYELRDLGNGGVEISRPGVRYQARVPVSGINEADLTTKIKSVFAADPNISSLDIHVNSEPNGIVQLTGNVPNAHMASTAIQDALNVTGVNAIDSFLTFNQR